jgi:hypothetical protein
VCVWEVAVGTEVRFCKKMFSVSRIASDGSSACEVC